MEDDLFTYGKTRRVGIRGMRAQARPQGAPLDRKTGLSSASGTVLTESSNSDEGSSPERRRRRRRGKKRGEEESLASKLMHNKAVAVDPGEDSGNTNPGGFKTPVKSPTINSRSYSSSTSSSPSPPPQDFSLTSPPDLKSLTVLEKADRALYQLKWSKVPYSTPGSDNYSSHDDSSLLIPREDLFVTLRVRCRGKVYKYQTMLMDPLSSVCSLLAADVGASADLILLSHRTNTLNPTETPLTLDLSTADIIDAIILEEPASNAQTDGSTVPASTADQNITIKIQTSKKSITYRLLKTDPLQKAMNAFAEALGVPLRKLRFTFDGEQVEPSHTAQELDMESDDVMDARVVS